MRISTRALLGLALLVPAVALAPIAGTAGAAPVPTVSATSGAPGALITVSVPDCAWNEKAGFYRYLQVQVVSGVTPDEVVIAAGAGEEGSATFVVPDWVDAGAPAVIEAKCVDFSTLLESFDFDDGPPAPAITAFAPVAFDVLPGSGAPTQLITTSRTSLLAGQAFAVDGRGCNLADAAYAGVTLFRGADRTGREFDENAVGGGEAELGADGSFRVEVSTGGYGGTSYGATSIDDVVTELDASEEPEHLEPGAYVAVAFCGAGDGTSLLYEPQAITITGSAPVADLDLTVAPGTRDITLAGGSCTVGPVEALLHAESVEEAFGDFDDESFDELPAEALEGGAASELVSIETGSAAGSGSTMARTSQIVPGGPFGATTAMAASARERAGARSAVRSSTRFGGSAPTIVAPDASGAWSISDVADFDQGFISAETTCGDPLGDGWVYDPQVAVVDVAPALVPAPAPAPIPAPAPVPLPVPAIARPGSPDYAG